MIKSKQIPESIKIIRSLNDISEDEYYLYLLEARLNEYLTLDTLKNTELAKFSKKILTKLSVYTYSNEIEKPHFHISFKNICCCYDLFTGKPIQKEPNELKKYSKDIQRFYNENKKELIEFYNNHLSDNAPKQARVTSYVKK